MPPPSTYDGIASSRDSLAPETRRAEPPAFDDAMDRQTLPTDIRDPLTELASRLRANDGSGALKVLQAMGPGTALYSEAMRVLQAEHDEAFQSACLARLGGSDSVWRVSMNPEGVRAANIDHRAGFLISIVDGATSTGEVLDVSGMTRFDALCILAMLADVGIITRSSARS